MFKKVAIAGLAVGAALTAAAVAPASAAPPAMMSVVGCQAHRGAEQWECVTPGGVCPKAARAKYGMTREESARYRCLETHTGTWRWKRA